MKRKARRANSGQFTKGYDARRHKFTAEECRDGFWRAIESIVTRYPDAVDDNGRHMSCRFLRAGRAGVTKRG